MRCGRMYRYLLFDLDGTLTDSKEGIMNCARWAIQEMGDTPPDDSILVQFVGPPLLDSFVEFCGYPPEKARKAMALYRERYVPIGQFENRPAPGIAEALARLKAQGYVMALASSKPQELCESICERFGLAPSLEVISGCTPENRGSKSAAIRKALACLGLREEGSPPALMVGDRKYDVLGARECGLDCLGVEFFGYAAPGELAGSGAIAVVHTVPEMEAFLSARFLPGE